MTCKSVGEADPTIAGYGIIIGFAGQAFISLILSIWTYVLLWRGRLEVHHDEGTHEYEIETKRLEIVSRCLMAGNDLQMIQGTALVISGLSSSYTMNLYHLHLVYDTVSLVGISSCAAVTCWKLVFWRKPENMVKKKKRGGSWRTGRKISIYMFSLLYLAYAIIVCQRLGNWGEDGENAKCYNTPLVTSSTASHPRADIIYVAVTAGFLLVLIGSSLASTQRTAQFILVLALGQLPVHVYMVGALRTSNQGLLEGGDENEWDFGQTVATVLLGMTISELGEGLREYWHLHRKAKHHHRSNAPETEADNEKLEEVQSEPQVERRGSVIFAHDISRF